MSGHTKGPWTIDLDQRVQFLDTDNRIETVFEIVNRDAGATPCYATNEEDARLIATAPEMLEALYAFIEHGDYQPVREKIAKAVAKAEGRGP